MASAGSRRWVGAKLLGAAAILAVFPVVNRAIAAAPAGPIEVEEKGKWYAAEVLKQDGEKTCIHYTGWSAKYDECVPASRIRPAPGAAAGPKTAAAPTGGNQEVRFKCPL